jgi:hypothetical protein
MPKRDRIAVHRTASSVIAGRIKVARRGSAFFDIITFRKA